MIRETHTFRTSCRKNIIAELDINHLFIIIVVLELLFHFVDLIY